MGDILSAISILLVFLTILLDLTSKEVSGIISIPKPDKNRIKELSAFNTKIRWTLFGKVLPIMLAYLVTTYVMLPKTVEIIMTTDFTIWNFDTLLTLYVLIEFGLVVLTIVALNFVFKLINKLNR